MTRRPPTRASARSPSRPRPSSRSRCTRAWPPAGPTSSCRRRATSSATAPSSTSRAGRSASAARSCLPFPTSSPGSRSSPADSASSSRLMPRSSSTSSPPASSPASTRPRSASARRCRRVRYAPPAPGAEPRAPVERTVGEHFVGELRLLRYRPLFSGPYVERVPELEFQRAEARSISARRRGAALDRDGRPRRRPLERHLGRAARADRSPAGVGVARVAEEHAGDLHQLVEVVRA